MMHVPDAFAEKMQKLLGADYENYVRSFDENTVQAFRLNPLKPRPAEFLRRSACAPVPWCDTGFYYEGEGRLSQTPLYHGGVYYIQEPSAMAPASFLPVRPGDRVLDLCAAPGGKAAALAGRLGGQGLLVANDVSRSRCRALLKNLELAGVKNALITCEPPERLSRRFPFYFDSVLVDAPCSGEGMFRKDPAMAAAWSRQEVERYAALQKEILLSAAAMVRPGGHLLYATCTYSPEENEQAAEALLLGDPSFSLVELPRYPGVDEGHPAWSLSGEETLKYCRRFWHHRVRGEGQFAALFRRKNAETSVSGADEDMAARFETKARAGSVPLMEDELKTKAEAEYRSKKKNRSEMRNRAESNRKSSDGRGNSAFLETLAAFFGRDPRTFSSWEPRLLTVEERVFLLPEGAPDLSGLRVVRSGLCLGDWEKQRFTPSQALAMALSPESFPRTLKVPAEDIRVEKYLRGETVESEGEDGWVLVCADAWPLGWGKRSRGRLKNKLAPGWRK